MPILGLKVLAGHAADRREAIVYSGALGGGEGGGGLKGGKRRRKEKWMANKIIERGWDRKRER